MIVEDERGMPENFWYISNGEPIDSKHNANRIERFLEGHRNIENQEVHTQLCIVIQWAAFSVRFMFTQQTIPTNINKKLLEYEQAPKQEVGCAHFKKSI